MTEDAPAVFLCRSKVSGKRGQLYDLRGFGGLTVVGAAAPEAVARDRYRAVQVFQLLAVNAYGLLAAPAEPFRPSRVAQREALVLFKNEFDFLAGPRGLEEVRRIRV